MVTSYADGSKVSFEQAIVANATGMTVAKLGMYGLEVPRGTPIADAVGSFPVEVFESESGIVDFIVGAEPAPGVFVIGRMDHPVQQFYLKAYKMGDGPFYCFYRPYHLCHFEVPSTVARAVLFNDPVISPLGPPLVDVVAAAKIDLKAGTILDGIGGYSTYGLCENTSTVQKNRYLLLGLSEGCRMRNNIKKDQVLTVDDVEIREDRPIYQLRKEQDKYFSS